MGRPRKPELPIVADNEEEAAILTMKKKRSNKPASLECNYNGTKSEIGSLIAQAHHAMKMPMVKSDEECRQRIDEYFDWCAERNSFPMWEELALYLGVVRTTLWNWQNGLGCSAERMNTVKKAKEAMATVDAVLAAQGKIQPVVYIFRAKNFFDMKDQQDVVLTPNQPLGEQIDQKQLEEKIIESVVVDD